MSKLRFLCIDGASSEVIPNLPSSLRWFSWRQSHLEILPTNFYHKKLVHMDLSKSWNIRQAWTNKPQNENQRFQKLKMFYLQNCWNLSESPDFSWFPYLKTLDLQYCRNLGDLHKSIGDLKSLVDLYLTMTNIKELPENICRLSSLKHLILGFAIH
ncbi:disease resistance protein RUN1-like [Telopea speciosissima]|uniref:disease resistance protein RUN1-like n=1 Tax=Telopea speciosissima TaxID=54955 RepID=UPI001CC60B3A|nr:disease resistance protein RUN1-like [Telopea speciosissima]